MTNHRPMLLLLALLALTLFTTAACSPALVKTTPKLPPGFLDAPVPAGDLSAYLYVSQESPVTMPLGLFGEVLPDLRASGLSGPVPAEASVERLAVWMGPGLDLFGGRIVFGEEWSAEVSEGLMSGRDEVTSWRESRQLNLVRGTGEWADAMTAALRSGDASPFEDAYPDMWELMCLLPESPPEKPVAAGFVRVSGGILDPLVARAGLDLEGVAQALGAIHVTDIAFAGYSDVGLALPEEVTPDYFKEAGVSAVFVARSGYPGFLLSFFLGTFADRVGLEKGSLANGQEVLSRELEDVHLVAKSLGNTLFLTLAPTREKAEALMSSVLEPQLNG